MDEQREDVPARNRFGGNVVSVHVDELDLTVRASNCLRRAGIKYVGDLVGNSPDGLLRLQGMGRKSICDIERALEAVGLRLGDGDADVVTGRRSDDTVTNARDMSSMHVEELDLTIRASNCLRRAEITCVGDLVRKTPGELLTIQNMGKTSVRDIERGLAAFGLRLAMSSASVAGAQNFHSGDAQGFDAFIDAMEVLSRHGINGAEEVTGMTSDEVLALPGFDRDTLEVVENGLRRWGLQLDRMSGDGHEVQRQDEVEDRERRDDTPEAVGEQGQKDAFSDLGATFREELTQTVARVLSGGRGVSPQCFLAYYGVDGQFERTLQEIGDAGEQYGFDRAVTRERVRQVLQKTERNLRANARRVRFVRWETTVGEARRHLPTSVQSFASRFGYESAQNPEHIFKMLKLCAGIFELEFPFGLRTISGLGTVVVDPGNDADLAFASCLREVVRGPYAELTDVLGQIGCDEELLRRVIDASPRWQFLDEERRYFWKRPRLPPLNYGVTGNAILTSLCKVFSAARCATSSDLARSVVRDRSLRRDGLVADLPVPVLEGIACRSGLFDVDDGRISRKEGFEWCVIGERDLALLRICVEHGRVVPSHVIYSCLLRSGLTRQNAAITVAYSPFLVHTRSGVGYKEGIYKFVLQADDIDLDALNASMDDGGERDAVVEMEDGAANDDSRASEARLRILVSSRTRLSGRFFVREPVDLDGEWDVQNREGIDIGKVTIAGRTVSGLASVITALELEKGDVLEMRSNGAGILMAGS